ncbi:hypothetical protein OU415_31865 [Saccharopolyspora sp. WRP15-2]|uniref:Uncharacterized protein n=1 Tax=Saccharopolyspora oryzae TaxID=2997343 RepID=A0ABT4V9T1_9PSEU|nr:hypothetical protein [Saccharopolyspora oryzae]MDA3630062.1 hypothetical protein [Saccharopolyspora oryzae]
MHQERVNALIRRVKEPSEGLHLIGHEDFARSGRSPTRRPGDAKECAAVADLAFAVVLIGGFLVLALILRGLERL